MANGHPVSESRVIYGVLVVIGFLALALLVAGCVTPAWLVLDYTDLTNGRLDLKISMGLWHLTVCVLDICVTEELAVLNTIASGIGGYISYTMIEYQVEAIISVVTMIIVLVCLMKIICCSPNGVYKNSKALWIVMCVCSAICAICALTAAGKYGRGISDAHNLLDTFGVSPFKLPYSLVLEGVGGILAGLFFIIIVIETIRAMNRINSGNQPQNIAMTTYPSGAQPYGAQPYAAQPYGAQPYAAQPYAAQTYAAQPYAAQPYSAQPYAAQPYAGQPYDGQAYNEPPSNSRQYGNQPDNNKYDNSTHSNSGFSDSKKYPPSDYRGQSRRY